MDEVRVCAPASVANVGPGFDVLGFALEGLGDKMIARKTEESGVRIRRIRNDGGRLALNPEMNTAGIAALDVLRRVKAKRGVELELEKRIPQGSGLGSSGASAVAGAFAVNALFDFPLTREELLESCLDAESRVSGFHADNVAASLFGGFVLIRSYHPLGFVRLGCVPKLLAVVIKPDFELETRQAREVLPRYVKLEKAVAQWGAIAGLVTGVMKKDVSILSQCICDHIIEPVRAPLIPGFYEVKKSALKNGALGCSISGAGPSVFALTDSKEKAENIASGMRHAFGKHQLDCISYISRISRKGVRVMER